MKDIVNNKINWNKWEEKSAIMKRDRLKDEVQKIGHEYRE